MSLPKALLVSSMRSLHFPEALLYEPLPFKIFKPRMSKQVTDTSLPDLGVSVPYGNVINLSESQYQNMQFLLFHLQLSLRKKIYFLFSYHFFFLVQKLERKHKIYIHLCSQIAWDSEIREKSIGCVNTVKYLFCMFKCSPFPLLSFSLSLIPSLIHLPPLFSILLPPLIVKYVQ